MRLSNVQRGALSASALALATALWSGCSPDAGVVFGGATGTGTTTGAGGEGQGSTTGGAGGLGAGGLGAGGDGGQGGAPPGCDLDGDGIISVNCPGGTDCDDDGDGHDALACAGGMDCDDTDSAVNPSQSNYFDVPSPNVGFDYNCNGMDDPEFEGVACDGLFCDFQQNVFLVRTVACGETGPFGNCGTFCGHENLTMNVQRCR